MPNRITSGEALLGSVRTDTIKPATSSGLKIGRSATEKIAFYNITPVVQPSAYTQTFATADKTHAATQTGAAMSGITTSTAGTALAEPGTTYAQAEQQQNYRRIQDRLNELRLDVDDVRQLVNAILDDLQALGLVS